MARFSDTLVEVLLAPLLITVRKHGREFVQVPSFRAVSRGSVEQRRGSVSFS